MTNARTLVWIERLVWILIYGGLLLLVLGIAVQREAAVAGWSLIVFGGTVAAAGVALLVVRAFLKAPPPG